MPRGVFAKLHNGGKSRLLGSEWRWWQNADNSVCHNGNGAKYCHITLLPATNGGGGKMLTSCCITTVETWNRDEILTKDVTGAALQLWLRQVSDLDTRKTLGPNERGEICLKNPALMKGYIGMDTSNYMDEEGFFRTGDVGHYDKDFYIDGRLKEIIKYRGFSVTPLELETLLQLHPGVREAGVVGKPVPVYGEVPVAFVVKHPGSTVTEQELVDYIAEEIDPFMQLRGGVKFIEEMPRNSMEKILKNKLKDLLGETKGN